MKEIIFNSPSWVFRALQMVAIEPIKWPSLSSDALSSYRHELSSFPYASASFHVGLQDYVNLISHESSDIFSHLGPTLLAAWCAKGLYHRIAQSTLLPFKYIFFLSRPSYPLMWRQNGCHTTSAHSYNVQPSLFLTKRPWCLLYPHNGEVSSCISPIRTHELRLPGFPGWLF
jgi:hypothetical protein